MKNFSDARIILVGGPGGVGKTTLAAALGLRLATEGHRTLVLTVDPAKRLAQALGFEGFQNRVQPVKLPGFPEASFHATMLDTQHYFDRVIERFAKSPEQKQRILNNRLYQVMVESLGGSHEYAAMERLLEFAQDPAYDRIIVDTPPTHNALDLLEAPERLAAFMDNSVLRWFQGGKAFGILSQGTRLAFSLFQKIVGGEFLTNLAEVLKDLDGMQAGFRERNLEVVRLLKQESTSFVLVTAASEARYQESVAFAKDLEKREIHLRAILLNRLENKVPPADASDEAANALHRYFEALYETQHHWRAQFQQLPYPVVGIPQTPRPPTDVEELLALSQHLLK